MKTVWKNPWVRFIGLLILIYLGLRILYVIRGVLIPFSLAMIVAYIFDPVVDWLEARRIGKLKLSRGVAVGVLVAIFAAFVAGFVFIAIPNAVLTAKGWLDRQEFENIKEFLPEDWQLGVEDWLKSTPEQRRSVVSHLAADLLADQGAKDVVGQSLRTIALSTFAAIMWVFQFFLFFVVMIYLLLDIDRFRNRVVDALPLGYKDEILRIGGHIDANLKAFFRGQVVVVAVLSVIFTVGLWAVGCPFWYIVGITGGVGAFVPYFALASGMVPAIILSFAEHQQVWAPLAAAAVFAVGLAIDCVFVTPRIIGKRVGIHPVMVILSILVFGTLFGFLGVLFAVPIAAVVKVLVQELFAKYKASELYTGEEDAEPEPQPGGEP